LPDVYSLSLQSEESKVKLKTRSPPFAPPGKEKAQFGWYGLDIHFSENKPLLSPAKARYCAASGVSPTRVGSWQPNRRCPGGGIVFGL